ncbi:MAG: PQQ-like beta-propeller repeat protein [Aureliella sp.]
MFCRASILLGVQFVLLFVTIGCTRKTPVTEIDIGSSGIELRDVNTAAVEWPVFRGPDGNGVLAEQTVPTTWSESENVRWVADVPGRGHGSPIVVGELVVLPTAIDDQEEQRVVAFDRETGDQVWNKLIHSGGFPSDREVHQKSTNANATLASDGQRLYAVFMNSNKVIATALDLNGEQVWQQEVGSFVSKFGFAPSPILYKSFVIVTADNLGGGYVAALDGETGEVAWRIARQAINSHSTPAIANVGGKEQMLLSGCDTVTSYDPATGEENWSTQCTSQTTCGTMVASEDFVLASGGFPDKQTVCLSANGEIQWENRTKIYEPSMLLVGDYVYAASDDGIAYCWDVASGKEQWKKRLGNNFSSSPWTTGGNIFVSDLGGTTYVFAASPDGFQQVAKNKLGSDCYATPAVVDGAIYTRVGTRASNKRVEKLYCIAQ